ncbi:P-loop containing nucleoside triphosphate hydrolase protein [Xylariaceae sp. FL0804]|nr:P-loop containing nucleoside triphosphate hydrolase protein [Xylariaceae sp. FL0804]
MDMDLDTDMEACYIRQFIPAGCVVVHGDQCPIPLDLLRLCQQNVWSFFSHDGDDAPVRLPAETQDALFSSAALKPFHLLWQNKWLRLSFMPAPKSPDSTVLGRVRVYLLPHDINRRNRCIRPLASLFSQLEYSKDCWEGKDEYTPQKQPSSGDDAAQLADQNASLLTMFNNVPSPDPHPEKVVDPDVRYTMECLLDSRVPGLITKLYPYQRRSAALMLQRESEPGRVVDPRLRACIDQEGKPWYCDDVSGLVQREPHYYDGSRGGILAEEMGTGKTLICLALILSTMSQPTKPPEPFVSETPVRAKIASLFDMAAAAANRQSVAWKPYFSACKAQYGYDYRSCIQALERPENRASYKFQNNLVEPRRSNRTAPRELPSKEVYLSYTTLIIVPDNLVRQWQDEIKKHTTGLEVLTLVDKDEIPSVSKLLSYDVLLFSERRFERRQHGRAEGGGPAFDVYYPLEYIQFKRCIIDEGHKLGNRSRSYKSDTLRILDTLEISARWVVTGTPSRGLYGLDTEQAGEVMPRSVKDAMREEHHDIQRIGNLSAKYLRVRPWANTKEEVGDRLADWHVYVMNKAQHSKGHDRKDCLMTTLNSLIIRHRLSDVSMLLPRVQEKVTVLDGSYQDQLSMNLFSMMIIFNSVQSQRTDMDYFFHERQRKSLFQLVRNLKQACFFGGVFYSTQEIAKALETAEGFLEKKTVPISKEDEDLLKQAIGFGKVAVNNRLKDVSNQFHAMPVYLTGFPGNRGKSWSLDDRETDDSGLVCTDSGMIQALQRFLNPCIDAPTSLQLMIESGRLDQQGLAERSQALTAVAEASGGTATEDPQATALAGNTALGADRHTKPKSGSLGRSLVDESPSNRVISPVEVAEPLARTKIISTVSAKLSYLIDSIAKYQEDEQIIVFYDNNNIAWYLAGILEILQIKHLIYTRAGLAAERRAQYVATFTYNQEFRVLLMDISQAAFGLDMKSASRIYFLSPVLNPQVEAQAIGRARRISQQRPVTVETLVLRHSIEEVIVERRRHMSQAEHSKVKNVLDDRVIYQWILNARIQPLPLPTAENGDDGVAQTAKLNVPQYVFGRGFGRELHPDDGLITGSPEGQRAAAEAQQTQTQTRAQTRAQARPNGGGGTVMQFRLAGGLKRPRSSEEPAAAAAASDAGLGQDVVAAPPNKRARARITFAEP